MQPVSFVTKLNTVLKERQKVEEKLARLKSYANEYKNVYSDTSIQISSKRLAFGPIITFSFESPTVGNIIGFLSESNGEWSCNVQYQPILSSSSNVINNAVVNNSMPEGLVSQRDEYRLRQLTAPAQVSYAPRKKCADCYQYH